MNKPKTALAITHVSFEDLGNLAPILIKNNYQIKYIQAHCDLENLDILVPDLVVILGGPIGVYEEDIYPFLNLELNLISQRIKADLPTLGICLGCQLMAKILGAKVYPGNNGKEMGWFNLDLTDNGLKSSLKYLENTSILQWHGDTFDLPKDATLLASSRQYLNQAFSYGKNILALQFHPEVTVNGLESWFIGNACEISITKGVTVSHLRGDTAKYGQTLQDKASLFWQNWLDSLS